MADHDVTQLLEQLQDGDERVHDTLFRLVYDQLHAIAQNQLRGERSNHTLNATALVHEAYLKLVGQRASWKNRAHFFAISAQAMRRILINYANQRLAQKRGGGAPVITFEDELVARDGRAEDVLALDDALNKLAEMSERQAKVVEYHFFAGLKHEEIAEVLQVSVPTVRRDWRLARAWLSQQLSDNS